MFGVILGYFVLLVIFFCLAVIGFFVLALTGWANAYGEHDQLMSWLARSKTRLARRTIWRNRRKSSAASADYYYAMQFLRSFCEEIEEPKRTTITVAKWSDIVSEMLASRQIEEIEEKECEIAKRQLKLESIYQTARSRWRYSQSDIDLSRIFSKETHCDIENVNMFEEVYA